MSTTYKKLKYNNIDCYVECANRDGQGNIISDTYLKSADVQALKWSNVSDKPFDSLSSTDFTVDTSKVLSVNSSKFALASNLSTLSTNYNTYVNTTAPATYATKTDIANVAYTDETNTFTNTNIFEKAIQITGIRTDTTKGISFYATDTSEAADTTYMYDSIQRSNYTYNFPSKSGTLAVTSDIPTVNNATLTIQKNGTTVKTFTANSATDVTANIVVPTKLSELTNDVVNNGTLTVQANGTSKGTFSANQSGNTTINITASDLGVSSAMIFGGVALQTLSEGGTQNAAASSGNYTASTQPKNGTVYLDKAQHLEYVWVGGSGTTTLGKWELLGQDGSYALSSVTVTGTGVLSGGGNLTANRTITHTAGNAASKSNGFYKFSTDAYSHIGSVTAVTKSDITALGIPESDTNTTYTLSGDNTAKITLTPSSGTAQSITINNVNYCTYAGYATRLGDGAGSYLYSELRQTLSTITSTLDSHTNDIETLGIKYDDLNQGVSNLETSKQDKLTAGNGIAITDNVIASIITATDITIG